MKKERYLEEKFGGFAITINWNPGTGEREGSLPEYGLDTGFDNKMTYALCTGPDLAGI